FSRSHERAGRTGDFLTSPEVSPLFAQCVARALQEDASALAGERFHLVEIGAGRGTLARDLWHALRWQPLAKRLHLHLVERSEAARAELASTLEAVPKSQWTAYAS